MESEPKILIVDDNPDIVQMVSKLLHTNGYAVSAAGDGEEGLRKALAEKPDLIVLDVMMPKMDGLEVCRRLKNSETTRLIPVVLLTSKDYPEDKVSGLSSGADDYITKPFETKEFVARIRGIIERQILREKLIEEDTLEAMEKMLESVAHEIRNPIVAIGGFARRIRDRLPPGEKLRIYAQYITREVERLETMVQEIVSLKDLVVNPVDSVDINASLDAALRNFDSSIRSRTIAVEKVFPARGPVLKGDRRALEMAFSHIIENAIDAMQPCGTLTLGIKEDRNEVHITFRDTGRGIPKHEIAQVVRPFYTSKMSGAGMGLATVKHIVTAHGGVLGIASTPGSGTLLTVSLPQRLV
jgi:two-component system, sensor histidine kinase and response regulator